MLPEEPVFPCNGTMSWVYEFVSNVSVPTKSVLTF